MKNNNSVKIINSTTCVGVFVMMLVSVLMLWPDINTCADGTINSITIGTYNDDSASWQNLNMHSNDPTTERILAGHFINKDLIESGSTDKIHIIKMPPYIPVFKSEAWTKFAKGEATIDYIKTGRQQKIVKIAGEAKSLTIGDKSAPRMDTVDVASYQSWMKQADFNLLKKSGVKATIVKLTEGNNYVNPYATNELKYAANAGMKTAVYHFVRFASVAQATTEANHFLKELLARSISKTTPVVADMEADDIAGNVTNNLSTFWSVLSDAGYNNQIVYTGKYYNWSKSVIKYMGLKKMWVPQYPFTPSSNNLLNTSYGAWQFSSTARLPGSSNNLDVSIDYAGIFVKSYDSITDQKSVNYYANVNQSTRHDGIYISGPYNTSADTSQSNSNGLLYNNRIVKVTKEATTERGTYAFVSTSDGKAFWIDKRALTSAQFDTILSTISLVKDYTITQDETTDGIFLNSPFMTSFESSTNNSNAKQYDGQVVQSISQEETSRSTYVLVKTVNGKKFWIDKRALTSAKFDRVLSTKQINNVYIVDQSKSIDGIFNAPYRTTFER